MRPAWWCFLTRTTISGIVERFCVEVGGLGQAQDAARVALKELRDSVGLPRRSATSSRAHSRHRFTPVAASTRSAMKAPPTLAAISRK